MSIDAPKNYTATFDVTAGTIIVSLFAKDAPKTVNNFVFLAKDGFYDGTVFHRVIPDFMVQGGDPTGTGRGGPGYKFEDETKGSSRKHKRGTLSMANAGPNTNGSQFFITHVVTDWLDGKHTVFGQVRSGQDIVNAVKQADTLKSVTIEEGWERPCPGMTREEAWSVVCEFVKSESLRRHMLGVEACLTAYADKFAQDRELWAVTALLHDFDWE